MPYDSLASLPANVKKKPEAAQRRWMATWNSHYKTCVGEGNSASSCESEAFRLANGVVKGGEMTDDETYAQPDGGAIHSLAPLGAKRTKRKMRQRYDDVTGMWSDETDGLDILLEKSDPRVDYRMAAPNAAENCGNCRFFDADCMSCNLVEGTITASGVSNLWTAQLAGVSETMTYREPTFRVFMDVAQAFNGSQDFSKPVWIPFLPVPGRYEHALYGEIIITPDSNRELVASVKNHVYQEHIPIDAEHETKLSGAVGWLNDMRMNADGGADALVEFTPRGQKLLADKAFKYVSPEWYSEWLEVATGKVHQNVVAGGAITTRPFFKEKVLRALVASESGVVVIKSDKEDVQVHEDKKTTAATEPDPPTEPTPPAPPTDEAKKATEATKTFSEAEVQALVEKTKAETAKTFTEQLKIVSDESKANADTVAAMQKADRTRRFSELASGRGGATDGAPWIGDPTKHVDYLERLTEKFGESDAMVTEYIEQQNAAAAQIKDSALFSEIGSGSKLRGDNAEQKLDSLAKAKVAASEGKLSYAQAYSEVLDSTEGQALYVQQDKETKH